MATFPSTFAILLNEIPKLNDKNWFQWKEQMGIVFLGAGMSGIDDDEVPTAEPELTKWKALDKQLTAYIYVRVAEEYRYLIKELKSARAAFKALKDFFERSTMGHRMNARQEFYSIIHDPSAPIQVYYQALVSAQSKLKALGVDISDMEFKDVLMHLHTDFHHIRVSILAQKVEPSLDDIKTMLSGAVSATEIPGVVIKQESVEISMAATHGHFSKVPVKVDHSSGHGSVDNKGYRWCNPVNNQGCHHCGQTGHVAARCMYDMPQHIRDWLMAPHSRSSSPSLKQPPHDSNAAYIDEVHGTISQAHLATFGNEELEVDRPNVILHI